MKQRTFRFDTRIVSGTSALGAFLVVTTLAALYAVGSLSDSYEFTATKTAGKLALAGAIGSAADHIRIGTRGIVMYSYAKNSAEVASSRQMAEENGSKLRQGIAEMRPLLVTERGKELLAEIEAQLELWRSTANEVDRLVASGDNDGAAQIMAQKAAQLFTALGKQTDNLAAQENQVLQQDRQATADKVSTIRWILGLLAIAGGATVVFCLLQIRKAVGELRRSAAEILEGSRQLAGASGQIASSSQSVAQGASEQAATLEETSSSASEITAITRKNAENTRSMAGLMTETARLVEHANHSLDEMVQSMKEINGSSEKISKIIRVIDEIAFQTNILALNAAVEAARAGEAGMGFAVVADEVRNLAQRSAQAARDTALLIEESIAKSNGGSARLDQMAASIRQITTSAVQVKTLVDEVDVGSQEQARGIEQIATAVGQMQQVTQRVAANSEESAAAGEELAAQAENLHTIVERLRGLLGAISDEPARPAAVSRPATESMAASTGASSRRSGLRESIPSTKSAATVSAGRGEFPLDDQELGF
jgi:methyl-accepting chemotaxis protein/methyl-accepting chemotaxis protein-1 (serine sensor receptor)